MSQVVSMFSPPSLLHDVHQAIAPAMPVLPPEPKDDEDAKKRRLAAQRKLDQERGEKTRTQYTPEGGLGTSPNLKRGTLLGG